MARSVGKCPICGKPGDEKFNPFCSSRCSLLDLGKWLGDGYRVETSDDDEEESASSPNSGDNEE